MDRRELVIAFGKIEEKICIALEKNNSKTMADMAIYDIITQSDFELGTNELSTLIVSAFYAGKQSGKEELKRQIANL